MNLELKICFSKSGSKYYEKAISLARECTNFMPADKGQPNIVTVTSKSLKADSVSLSRLCQLVERWRATTMVINGRQVPTDRVSHVLRCYGLRERTAIQETYCFRDTHLPGWGCCRLDEIRCHIHPCAYTRTRHFYWYQVGHFITDTAWRIDKKEILRLLKREADLKCLHLCPVFSFERATEAIERLPDEIDTESNELWEVDYLQEPGRGARAVGIRPKPIFDE